MSDLHTAPRTEGDLRAEQAEALARACNALWSATLSLMVAFMQTRAPAHRLLLAKRIARNYQTLRHEECFTVATRESFARLARRWEDKAAMLDETETSVPRGPFAILARFFALPR